MGYTHYLRRPKVLDEKKFVTLEEVTKRIIEIATVEKDIEIYNMSKDNLIHLNGVGELEHEDLYLPQDYPLQEWQKPKDDGLYFTFCKTARKPYDVVVAAVLLVTKALYDDEVEFDSDGSPHELIDAYTLAKQAVTELGLDDMKAIAFSA